MAKQTINFEYFEKLNNKKVFWLGWIAAHNPIYRVKEKSGDFKLVFQITVGKDQKKLLYDLMKSLESTYKISYRPPKTRFFKKNNKSYLIGESYQVSIYSEEFCRTLFEYGINVRKTKPPQFFYQEDDISGEYRTQYTNGYLKGGGKMRNLSVLK